MYYIIHCNTTIQKCDIVHFTLLKNNKGTKKLCVYVECRQKDAQGSERQTDK